MPNTSISINSSNIASLKQDQDLITELTAQFLAQGNVITQVAPNQRSEAADTLNQKASFNVSPALLAKMDQDTFNQYGELVKDLLVKGTSMKDILLITGMPYPAFVRLRDKLKEVM